jgi:hypothetical protein
MVDDCGGGRKNFGVGSGRHCEQLRGRGDISGGSDEKASAAQLGAGFGDSAEAVAEWRLAAEPKAATIGGWTAARKASISKEGGGDEAVSSKTKPHIRERGGSSGAGARNHSGQRPRLRSATRMLSMTGAEMAAAKRRSFGPNEARMTVRIARVSIPCRKRGTRQLANTVG